MSLIKLSSAGALRAGTRPTRRWCTGPASLIGIVAILLGLSAADLFSANNFGAIAYDRKTNAYGVAWDMPTQAAANQRALSECVKSGKNCSVVVSFANQCAAYATGQGDTWGYGTGGSRAVAESAAQFYCSQNGKGCQVRAWGCTTRAGSGQNNGNSSSPPAIDRDANRRRAEENRRWGGEEQYNRTCRESGGC